MAVLVYAMHATVKAKPHMANSRILQNTPSTSLLECACNAACNTEMATNDLGNMLCRDSNSQIASDNPSIKYSPQNDLRCPPWDNHNTAAHSPNGQYIDSKNHPKRASFLCPQYNSATNVKQIKHTNDQNGCFDSEQTLSWMSSDAS